jgi:hypothetical protein
MKTGAEIKDLVIVKLEEYSQFMTKGGDSGPVLFDWENLDEIKPIYSYIDKQLQESADEVLSFAPLHKLYPVVLSDHTVEASNDGTGVITVPQDFLRLHTLKMKEWSVPIHIAISVDHPLYRHQLNKYTRGHKDKPVAVLNHIMQQTPKVGYNLLTYFSVEKDHTVEKLLYIKKFEMSDDYHDTVAELIALNCAKKVYEVFGNTEQVSLMTSEIQNVQNVMLL